MVRSSPHKKVALLKSYNMLKGRIIRRMNLSKKKKIILAVGTVLFLAVVCGFVTVMAIGGNRGRNAQEQLSLGERYLAEMNYERAVAAFELAIELEPRNIDAYIGLSEAYEGLGNTDLALEALETAREKIQELVREGEALPDSAAEVYLMLVRMYEEAGNYEEVRLLLEEALNVTDSAELQEIWEAYMPEVEFSLAAGEYEEGTELTLTTEGQAVYYTLDGSDPVKEGEETAEVVIVLQEGNWTIRAAAEGRGGTLGNVTEVEYVVVAAENTEESESESTEVTEETEPESVESTEEETEPESESAEVTEETEPESVENTEEEEDKIIIRVVIGECYGSYGITRNVETKTDWRELIYPINSRAVLLGNRDITGTLTVLAYDTKDILVTREFELKDIENFKAIEVEVPLRNGYIIDVSADGYTHGVGDFIGVSADGYLSVIENISELSGDVLSVPIGLTPVDVDWTDVMEIKFLSEAGDLIYPNRCAWLYKNTEGEFEPFSSWQSPGALLDGCGLYLRYVEGVTMGIQCFTYDWYREEAQFSDYIYEIIPGENGIAYITLSDYDIENMIQ